MDEQQVIKEYGSQVRAEARNIRLRSAMDVPIEDLEQVGLMGLLSAWRRYDPTRNPVFWAFAKLRVVGAIKNHVADHRNKTRSLVSMGTSLIEQTQGDGVDRHDAADLLNQITVLFVASESEQHGHAALWAAVELLPERERDVIAQAFRFGTPFKDIASNLGINKSGVSRAYHSALAKLRAEPERDDES